MEASQAAGHAPVDLLTDAEPEQRAAERRQNRNAPGVGVSVVRVDELEASTLVRRRLFILELAVHHDHVLRHLGERYDASAFELNFELLRNSGVARVADELEQASTIFGCDDDGRR
jgi:hypothetical protein